VVGIVAAKLVDQFQRPAFVIGIDPATGIGRGSARTTGGINLYDALASAPAAWTGSAATRRRPGSRCAARRSMRSPRRSAARSRARRGLRAASWRRDRRRRRGQARRGRRAARRGLAGLGPFGQANPTPLLVTRNAKITAARRVGDGSHLKLTVEDDRQIQRSAIGLASATAPSMSARTSISRSCRRSRPGKAGAAPSLSG